MSTRRLSYAALLAATALTGTYATSPVPNLELITLVVFGAGILLGARDGVLVATVVWLAYSLLNPYGPAHPLVTASQVVGTAPVAVAGSAFAKLGLPQRSAGWRALALGVVGAVLTLFFDLVTNLATGLLYGQLWATLVMGVPFALWHIAWNVALFVVLGTPLTGVFWHYRSRLSW